MAAVAVEYFLYDRYLNTGYATIAAGVTLLVGVAVFATSIWRVLERAESNLHQAYATERSQRQQLVALQEATLDLTSKLDPAEVMQKVVDKSCEVIGARYGALAILKEDETIGAVYTHGIDAAARARMAQRTATRLEDIALDPAIVGFPENRPPLQTMLATPVLGQGKVLGNLYLASKLDNEGFTAPDREILERFAAQAAIAVNNARLYGQLESLSVVAERERIAMDLHDGVIQALYAVMLQLESSLHAIEEASSAYAVVDGAIDRLGDISADIRHYVFDLRSQLSDADGFPNLLRNLLSSLPGDAAFETTLHIEGDCSGVERSVQWELWHIAREALSNAVRHSGGNRLEIRLSCTPERIILAVADDGKGLLPSELGREHNGLRNMRQRAETLGGELVIDSTPGQGTTVRITVEKPLPEAQGSGGDAA